jgi:arabinofuranan 3-O-arabinosyltransferase
VSVAAAPPRPSDAAAEPREWWRSAALLAAIAYVPFLLSSPGRVSADTKQYLYLDPGRLLTKAAYLWDPGYGAGSVTHQNIGYLFPMGPYYWLMHELGSPDWLAQRLWLGSISVAAGVGVLFLLATLRWRSQWTAFAAALVYMLTPYQLAYSGRISAILLPWAGLPWMVALTARAVRRGGWRDPARFALVVLIVGSTNATSLLLVGLAPALWLVFAVLLGDADARQTVAAGARIAGLVVLTSLWWIAGLVLQGGYGINYLDVSETVRTVAEGSSPTEVLRGLGNWFFYGGDAIGPWIKQAVDFTQHAWLLVVSFAVPVLAFAAAAVTRWRYRAYFVALLVVGVVASVGAFPYDDPSPIGGVFKSWATGSSAGLAMRSTPRAVPLVVLAIAVLIGAGLEALAAHVGGTAPSGRRRWITPATIGLVVVIVLAGFVPVWRDGYVSERDSRDEAIPRYWLAATAAADREGTRTRVLEIPGTPSAAYRWGATGDPITPGLIDRSWVARELIPYFGSAAAANLVIALDHRMQEGTFEPSSLAPIARLLNSGTVLVRSDLEYERGDTPRPRLLWRLLTDPRPRGLGAPEDFGSARPNMATRFPLLDELELGTPARASWPPPVALFPVSRTPSIVSTAPTRRPVLVAGDGEGLVDAAAAGWIDGTELVLYSASYAGEPGGLRRVLRDGADLLVSDTNRRRARQWGAIRDVSGRTERAGEVPLRDDPEDKRLEVFPRSTDADRSVVEQRHGTADATAYGARSVYFPDQRAAAAFDNDPATAWRVGGGDDPRGERLELRVPIDAPRASFRIDRVRLSQPHGPDDARFITKVRLHLGARTLDVDLDPSSRTDAGQVVRFPAQRLRRAAIEVLATNADDLATYGGQNGVGFAEVRFGGARAPRPIDEVVRMPTRLVRAAGAGSLAHRLVYLMSRLGYDPAARGRSSEEPTLARELEVPQARSFSVTGVARVDPNAPDPTLDDVLGTTAPGTTYDSTGHLRGDAGARASRAFDGDPRTAWVAPMGPLVNQVGQAVDVKLGTPITVGGVSLTFLADGRHSVPTRIRVEAGGSPPRTFDVPPVSDRGATTTVTVPVSFPPVTTSSVRLVIDAVRPVVTPDPSSHLPIELPVGIAEAAVDGVPRPASPVQIPAACRTDLLAVDGHSVPVVVAGRARAAERHRGLDLHACDGSALALAAGRHVVRGSGGARSGLEVDRVALGSDRGGNPLAPTPLGAPRALSGARARVTGSGQTHVDAEVRTSGRPFWVVLGQSRNDGWSIDVDGGHAGPARLVNGYANGWEITPTRAGTVTVRFRWTPQDLVWWAIGVSVLAILVCVALALWRRRSERDVTAVPASAADGVPTLVSPLRSHREPGSPRGAILGAVAVAVLAGASSRPWIGIVVGVATLAVGVLPRARAVLSVGSVVALALAAAYVTIQQARYGYPTISSWPSQFGGVADVTWLALWLLAADVVVEWTRARPSRVTSNREA